MKLIIQLKLLFLKNSGRVQRNLSAQLLMLFLIFSGTHSYAAKVKVGDSFGGGTVFCVSDTADTSKCVTQGSGEYGLIMANKDQVNFDSNSNHGVTWATDIDPVLGARSEDDGAANTAAIIKAFPKDNPSNNAAWVCSKYKDPIEGHTDWYLPAKNELNKIYLFAKANNLIGKGCTEIKVDGMRCLVSGDSEEYKSYWSSTEYSGLAYNSAWLQNALYGFQDSNYKINAYFAVRAIRAFNNSATQKLNSAEAKSSSDHIKEGAGLESLSNNSAGLTSQRMQESVRQEETKPILFPSGKEL